MRVKKSILMVLVLSLFTPLGFVFGDDSHLIITEVQIEGNSSRNDFIEIYNPTNADINIGKYKLRKKSSSGKEYSIKVFSGDSEIQSGDYFLWANSDDGYANSIQADCFSSATIAKNNSIAFLDPEDKIIDSVAWGESNSPFVEKNPFSQNPLKNQGLRRKQTDGVYQDTDDNANDFEIKENSSPNHSSQSESQKSLFADAGSDIISVVDKEITFDASNSTGNINKYSWNFGDGVIAEGKTVSHKYSFSGEYYISLNVSNENEDDSDLIKITIFSNSIFISEFLPNPKGEDSGKEWIEISNLSNEIQNASNWGLSTSEEKIDFIFSQGSYLSSQNFLFLPSSLTKISLSNDNGSLFLFYPSGDICQEIKYEEIEENYSIARKGREYFYTKDLTPGMINIVSGELEGQENVSGSILPESSLQGGKDLQKETIQAQTPKTSTRKILTQNLMAEAQRNKKALALSGLGIGIFSGFFGLSLVSLRRRLKRQRKGQIFSNKEKEIMEIEVEK